MIVSSTKKGNASWGRREGGDLQMEHSGICVPRIETAISVSGKGTKHEKICRPSESSPGVIIWRRVMVPVVRDQESAFLDPALIAQSETTKDFGAVRRYRAKLRYFLTWLFCIYGYKSCAIDANLG
jgi:hypothetical protein